MTTSSIKRRRSPHDAPASNDGDDDDALEMENNDIEPQNNSITSNRRSSRSSSTTSSDGSVLASATSVAAAAVSVSGDAFDAADRINRINSNLGKRDSEEDSWASKGYSYINPFVHRIQIDSHIEVAKVSFLFLTSLPHYLLITLCTFLLCFPLTFPYAFIHAKQLKNSCWGAGKVQLYLTLV